MASCLHIMYHIKACKACRLIVLQQVMSSCRLVQDNATAASYWLHRVLDLDDGRHQKLEKSIVQVVPATGGGACNALLHCLF